MFAKRRRRKQFLRQINILVDALWSSGEGILRYRCDMFGSEIDMIYWPPAVTGTGGAISVASRDKDALNKTRNYVNRKGYSVGPLLKNPADMREWQFAVLGD